MLWVECIKLTPNLAQIQFAEFIDMTVNLSYVVILSTSFFCKLLREACDILK